MHICILCFVVDALRPIRYALCPLSVQQPTPPVFSLAPLLLFLWNYALTSTLFCIYFILQVLLLTNTVMSFNSGYSRGGFAPRRGRGGRGSYFTKSREPIKLDTKKHPLGELLRVIRDTDLESENSTSPHDVTITGCQYIASYNWLSDKKPTIIMPGK